MKTRKVKIHSKEWFESNCQISDTGVYMHPGSDYGLCVEDINIIGCEVDLIYDAKFNCYVVAETYDKEDIIIENWMIEEVSNDIKPTTKEILQKLVGDLTSEINSIEYNIEEGDFFQMGKCDALKCVRDKLAFIILNDTEDGNSNN